jgi:hypothetical protein
LQDLAALAGVGAEKHVADLGGVFRLIDGFDAIRNSASVGALIVGVAAGGGAAISAAAGVAAGWRGP